MIRIEPYDDKEVKSVLTNLMNNEDFMSFIKSNLNKSTSKFLSIPGSSLLVMQLFKSKIKNKNISLEERLSYQNKLNDLPRNGSSIRHRNRCEVTGRPRGNYRKFGLSRIKLRELSMSGDLPGVVKSSW